MASEQDEALRESAQHRGLKLVKSRRRKAGGDFGKFGLKDAGGAEVFGFGNDGLTASAEEIEAFLRGSMRADWGKSAEGLPAPKRRAAPPPAQKPKLQKLGISNLLSKLPAAKRGEAFTELARQRGVRIERIVSQGQVTPEDQPMRQDADEWVLVLSGAARLRIEGFEAVALKPGDHLLIAAGQRHWVTWTDPQTPTVWLAVHFG